MIFNKWKEVAMHQRRWHLEIVCKSYKGSKFFSWYMFWNLFFCIHIWVPLDHFHFKKLTQTLMFLNLWCYIEHEKAFYVIPIQMKVNFIANKLVVILYLSTKLHGLITIDLSLTTELSLNCIQKFQYINFEKMFQRIHLQLGHYYIFWFDNMYIMRMRVI